MKKIIQYSITSPSYVQTLRNQLDVPLLVKSFPTISRAWRMSKHYETNSMYLYLSRAFQRYQEHDVCPNIMKPTQCTLTCQELSNDIKSMAYVQTLWNQLNVPLLIKSFPTIPRAWRKALSFWEILKWQTKQTNYLP